MRPEDAEKLLGGYATGTLTVEEREALFQAALGSQELFDALADEHALKELLDDPVARRRLLDALGERKAPLRERLARWLARPAPWAIAGVLAATILLAVFVSRTLRRPEPVSQIAMHIPKAAEPAPEQKAAEPASALAPAPKDQPAKAEKPAAKARKPAAPAAAGVAGGVGGGVAGGVAGGIAPAAAPSSATTLAKEAEPAAAVDAVRFVAAERSVLRCTIERAGAGGEFAEVDPHTVFRESDRLRLIVRTEEDGYLDVSLRDSAHRQTSLFRRRVERGKPYIVPAGDSLRLEGPAGELTLAAAFSRRPPPDSEALGLTAARVKRRDEDLRAARPAQSVAETSQLSEAPAVVEIPIIWK